MTAKTSAFAFQPPSVVASKNVSPQTCMKMSENHGDDDGASAVTSRRALFQSVGLSLAAAATAAVVAAPQPAEATYSAYTHREQDWQERLDKGDVKISTARDLRRQLREIAPMNDEGSKIFCPNGPSAAVSPMMENKCGDRMAIPSVYGRTEDIVGNSIPGFEGGRYTATMPAGGSSSIAADIGGFPSYNTKMGR